MNTKERYAAINAALARVHTPEAFAEGDCWVWPGEIRSDGYGRTARNGQHLAHRAAWVEAHGDIPAGRVICHRCDNPPCYRPSHLFIGSHADNQADKARKGRHFAGDGRADGRIRLTDEQVAEIRQLVASGGRYVDVAYQFGVSKSHVAFLAKGQRRPAPVGVTPARPTHAPTTARVLTGKVLPTHCPQEHPYSGANLAVRPNGHRWCRQCARDRRAASRAEATS